MTDDQDKLEKLEEIEDYLERKQCYTLDHQEKRNELLEDLITSAVVIGKPRYKSGEAPMLACEINESVDADS